MMNEPLHTASAAQMLEEVLTNIKDQILVLEAEMLSASLAPEVRELYQHIHEILQHTQRGQDALVALVANKSTAKMLEAGSETVNKLKSLGDAINTLEKELREVDFDYFRIVAELLAAAKVQMHNFDAYAALPNIVLLKTRLDGTETELKRQVQWSLREIGQLVDDSDANEFDASSVDVGNLGQAYLLVNVLGKSFRDDLLERFAQLQLLPYEKNFAFGKSFCELQHLDKRFQWFKKLMRAVNATVGAAFPAGWCLSYHLYKEFARRSRTHLAAELSALEMNIASPEAHVDMLLKALKYIYDFEKELRKEWAAAAQMEGVEGGAIEYDLKESVGDAFDPFLGPYIQKERKTLDELLSKLLRDEEADPKAGEKTQSIRTFDSAGKMFEFIKSSLKRCTMLSSGNALLQLSEEFRVCLQLYARSLKRRCPVAKESANGKMLFEVGRGQEIVMSRIINTCEYCGEVVPQLETMVQQLVKPHLMDKVTFAPEIDSFMDVIAATIDIIVSGAMDSRTMRGAFEAMRNSNWSTCDAVGDDSPYVTEIRKALSGTLPCVRDHISLAYFKTFCTKMTSAVLDKFQSTIFKLKRVAKTAGGQLLLDLSGIKELMLKLPLLRYVEGGPNKPTIAPVYTVFVRSKAEKIEIVLKLVCVEDHLLDELFKALWPGGSEEDLQRIKKIKGLEDKLNPLGIDDPEYLKFRHGLDQAKGKLKDVGEVVLGNPVGKGFKVMASGVKDVASGVKDGVTGVIGSGGKLDVSRHSDDSQQSAHTMSTGDVMKDFKHAFGGVTAFMKSGMDAASGALDGAIDAGSKINKPNKPIRRQS